MSVELATRFFGSVEDMQRLLVNGVLKRMQEQGVTPEELDKRCLFKWNGFPCCEEFSKDPTKITGPAFSLASFALDLKVDEVLGVNEKSFQKKMKANAPWILKHMKKNNAYIAGAYGSGEEHREVTAEDLMPVYVLLKSLECIEPEDGEA